MIPGRELPAFVSFDATVVHNEDGPDECTIRPSDAGPEGSAAWITAEEGSFCLPPNRA